MRELGLYDDAGTLIAVRTWPKVINLPLPKAQGVRRPPHGHHRQQCGLSGADH